jgi:hypothetical protein
MSVPLLFTLLMAAKDCAMWVQSLPCSQYCCSNWLTCIHQHKLWNTGTCGKWMPCSCLHFCIIIRSQEWVIDTSLCYWRANTASITHSILNNQVKERKKPAHAAGVTDEERVCRPGLSTIGLLYFKPKTSGQTCENFTSWIYNTHEFFSAFTTHPTIHRHNLHWGSLRLIPNT